MIVETKLLGRRTPFERRSVPLPDGPHTLESLLTHLVHHEVTAYEDRQNSAGVLRVLTEQELHDSALTGRVSVAPQDRAGTVTPDDATRTALTAFRDGLYYVFLDDRQIRDLSAPVTLRPDSTLLLLRLTALAGG
ncbi:hypothetical protein LAJ19_02180 [Deinococcus taeanensis]|uniref:hypothetical protein n=1 Tax=Deinococcus taeanensis TaxID=2737050 RepID=UPI001CDD753A|nr:hypothetical protein [Deinococcus taeanensis]UBV43054.1 hypothetical protein LAJ19_02180 [Deinococcus taeanensis]